MEVQIKMTLELPVRVTKKEKWFVASCPALDVFSQGDTRETAVHSLGDALMAFLASCLEHGTLDDVLKSCGFMPVFSHKERDPANRPDDQCEEKIEIPLYLLANMTDSGRCHRA